MPSTPGTETTIVQPWFYYAPRLTPLPGPKHGFRVPLATPWTRLENFDDENAVVVDFNNPKIRVNTQDHGIIATNPSGDDAITVAVATQTPSGEIIQKALSLVSYIAAEVVTPGSERPEIESWWFDPNANKNFMILVEGIALAGGVFEEDTKVYFVCYNVEPGEQAGGRGGRGGGGGGGRGGGGGGRRGGAQPGQLSMNYKGENAHLQVALQLDVQPEPGISSVFTGTPTGEGTWPAGVIDPFKRANFLNVKSIA